LFASQYKQNFEFILKYLQPISDCSIRQIFDNRKSLTHYEISQPTGTNHPTKPSCMLDLKQIKLVGTYLRMVWYGMVWYGMVRYGMVWYGKENDGCPKERQYRRYLWS